MPRPVYIICSQSGAEDKATGLVSFFNVVERLHFAEVPLPDSTPLVELRITAVWTREPDDEGRTFDYEVNLASPGTKNELQLLVGSFQFTAPNYRLTGRLRGGLPIEQAGVMSVTARLKRSDSDQWVAQTYPIIVEIATQPEEAEAKPVR